MASKLHHHLAAVRRYQATGIWLKYGHRPGDYDLYPAAKPYPKPRIVREGRFLLKLISNRRGYPSFLPVRSDTRHVTKIADLYAARVGEPQECAGPNDIVLDTVFFDLLQM